jgi:L-asparaginase/Glu-tRNA(Gln) amidotransferase subunit D
MLYGFFSVISPVSFAELPTVVIVTTGGTIAEKTDVKTAARFLPFPVKTLLPQFPDWIRSPGSR